jgi:hypothetical protein
MFAVQQHSMWKVKFISLSTSQYITKLANSIQEIIVSKSIELQCILVCCTLQAPNDLKAPQLNGEGSELISMK